MCGEIWRNWGWIWYNLGACGETDFSQLSQACLPVLQTLLVKSSQAVHRNIVSARGDAGPCRKPVFTLVHQQVPKFVFMSTNSSKRHQIWPNSSKFPQIPPNAPNSPKFPQIPALNGFPPKFHPNSTLSANVERARCVVEHEQPRLRDRHIFQRSNFSPL